MIIIEKERKDLKDLIKRWKLNALGLCFCSFFIGVLFGLFWAYNQ